MGNKTKWVHRVVPSNWNEPDLSYSWLILNLEYSLWYAGWIGIRRLDDIDDQLKCENVHIKRPFALSSHAVFINLIERASIKAWLIDEQRWCNSRPLIVSKLNA